MLDFLIFTLKVVGALLLIYVGATLAFSALYRLLQKMMRS